MPKKLIRGVTGKETSYTIFPIRQREKIAKYFIVLFNNFTIILKKTEGENRHLTLQLIFNHESSAVV